MRKQRGMPCPQFPQAKFSDWVLKTITNWELILTVLVVPAHYRIQHHPCTQHKFGCSIYPSTIAGMLAEQPSLGYFSNCNNRISYIIQLNCLHL